MKILTVCVLGFAMIMLARATVWRSRYCPHGWSLIHGRCFRYFPMPMTWATAERNCRLMGANLASVHNSWEYRGIQRLILFASHKLKQTWIGGSDAQQEKVWLWSDGKAFHYTKWCQGEPNNLYRQQHCMQMNHGGWKCWGDVACNNYRPFVCARKLLG